MRTIGLIGGLSWESTALYYRQLNELARERLGGLHSAEILLWSFDFAEVEALQAAGDWAGATRLMVGAARRLEAGGAGLLVICSNTMHRMAGEVEAATGLPLVHIADATGVAARRAGVRRPALLATRYTMEQEFYVGRLRERHGVEAIVPDAGGRELVHRVIYEELCLGVVRAESKAAYLDVVDGLRRRGADGVILGCTEVTMLIGQGDVGLPVLDTTRLHVEAAMEAALA
ncbi:MAG TPA: aspartate/glutamate racemase family protein [Geminicoccaceae bacterium]